MKRAAIALCVHFAFSAAAIAQDYNYTDAQRAPSWDVRSQWDQAVDALKDRWRETYLGSSDVNDGAWQYLEQEPTWTAGLDAAVERVQNARDFLFDYGNQISNELSNSIRDFPVGRSPQSVSAATPIARAQPATAGSERSHGAMDYAAPQKGTAGFVSGGTESGANFNVGGGGYYGGGSIAIR